MTCEEVRRGGAGLELFEPLCGDVEECLRGSSVFDSIVGDARRELVDSFDGVRLRTGEVLMSEGEVADALYLVRHGRLRTTVAGADGSPVQVGQVGKSEVVGEMALITDERRSATVTAMRDTDLYRLPADAFAAFTQAHPEVLRPFAGVVVARLRDALTGSTHASLPATIVLVPTPGARADELAHAISRSIGNYDTATVSSVDAADRANPAAWLLDVENAVDVSLLVADDTPTAWTKQCLRHADRVLIVADQSRPAALTPVEADPECAKRLAELPVELVMRYRSHATSSRWLRDRTLDAHHNLRDGSADDIARLVRRITGDATVLVLGGGGARGFAHVGVIRALLESGIDIDAVVGASAGAVVGGGFAHSGDLDAVEGALLGWFDAVRWRRDMNPPALALLTGRLMTEGFQEFFGDWRIEDLGRDFAAVSCDLTAAAPFVHTEGPLWQAIRASAAVPGIFPPVALEGRVLVDGGLVANLPVDIAKHRHQGAHVIAVEVGDPTGIEAGHLDGSGIANGWRRSVSRSGNTPTLPRILMRLTELGRSDNPEDADTVIRPDVRGFGLTDTKPARTIIDRGYQAAVATIEAEGLEPPQS